jgi:Na+-driven multidrug efflux pump
VFFVVVLNMSVVGVAIATVVSQAISAFLCIVVLIKSDGYGALKIKHLKFYKEQFKKIAYIAIPSGLQSIAFNISNVLISSTINSFEVVGTSANSTAQQFDGLLYHVGNAIALSTMAFVSQNLGAKKMDRVKTSIIYGVITVVMLCFSLGMLLFAFAPFLCGIIATSQEVIDMAVIRLSILGGTYFIASIMEVLSYSIRAMGKPIISLIISIIGAVIVRIICLKITFAIWPYFATIYVSYPVSWLFTTLVFIAVIPFVFRKIKNEIENQ